MITASNLRKRFGTLTAVDDISFDLQSGETFGLLGPNGAGWAIMLVMAMTGGSMVPLMFMPSWMLTLSNFSVVKWAIYAFEGAIWRQFTLTQMMLPVGILLGIGLAAYAIGVSILVRTDR